MGAYANTQTKLIRNETIYVDKNNTAGPWDGTIEHPYQYIKDAIENSTDGDTIFVFNGTYYENVLVNKELILIGQSKKNTIIDGMYNEFIISIINDNVRIENFTLRNSGGYQKNSGIKIETKNNCIKDCIFYRTKSGIYINETDSNEIHNCIFYKNGEGVILQKSNGCIIKDCCFCHNSLGINVEQSNGVDISNCYAHTNGIGLFINRSFPLFHEGFYISPASSYG